MLTRCPACATHFRVTPEQLKARSGRVRCGACHNTFNALDTLIEAPMLALSPAPAVASPESVSPAPLDIELDDTAYPDAPLDEDAVSPAPTFEAWAPTHESVTTVQAGTFEAANLEPAPQLDPNAAEAGDLESTEFVFAKSDVTESDAAALDVVEPDVTESDVSESDAAEVTDVADAEDAVSDVFVTTVVRAVPVEYGAALQETASPSVAADEVEADPPAWSETFPDPPPSPRRWPWAIGGLLALVALIVQATLAFRVELAVLWPESRPLLTSLCDLAECEIGLPTRINLVGIEASDLFPDSEHRGRLALTATLKSRAPFAQQFPHIELTLTDSTDQAIARKVLAPADYLPSASSIASGMPPNADIVIAIGIEPAEIVASGYRLYLFYP